MLQRIGQTLDQLSKTFMSITISPSNDEQNEQSLASMLGEIVWPSFTDIIIKDYLEKCVPTTSSQVSSLAFIIVLILPMPIYPKLFGNSCIISTEMPLKTD